MLGVFMSFPVHLAVGLQRFWDKMVTMAKDVILKIKVVSRNACA